MKCVQRINQNGKTISEIVFKDYETQAKIEATFQKIQIKDVKLIKCQNREVKDIQRRSLLSVVIYEAPFGREIKFIYKAL